MNYIISDIHGCFYTLEKLLKKIFKKEEHPQLIFVGDYIDRGLHSKQVLNFMIELQSEGAICLRGNHDDIVDYLVNGECVSDLKEFCPSGVEINRLNIASWWLINGFGPTLQNYVNMSLHGNPLDFILKIFAGSVPKKHREFLRGLKMHWENETHFACHAYLDPTEPLPRILDFLPESANQEMLWTRFEANYIDSGIYGQQAPAGIGSKLPVWDKIGVFGHTPTSFYGGIAPIKHGNLRLIDTGAFKGEYLCAYIVEQDCWLLQATDSRDIISS